jgi:hypothetical protein
MMDYEDAAQKSIIKLQRQQEMELKTFRKIRDQETGFKVVFSKDLILLR